MRDEDEETRPLRFGAVPEGKAPCIKCGAVDDLPKGVEYDEYICGSCQRTEADEEEQAEAEAWLQHMVQVTEGKQ